MTNERKKEQDTRRADMEERKEDKEDRKGGRKGLRNRGSKKRVSNIFTMH